jgi:hypothetical protein
LWFGLALGLRLRLSRVRVRIRITVRIRIRVGVWVRVRVEVKVKVRVSLRVVTEAQVRGGHSVCIPIHSGQVVSFLSKAPAVEVRGCMF